MDRKDRQDHRLRDGADSAHYRQALRACWPYLKRGPQNILDIGPDPIPWLRMIEQSGRAAHRLAGCLQNAEATTPFEDVRYPVAAVELDIWSPLARKGLPAQLPRTDYTLITALGLIDHLYHPEPLFGAVAQALRPDGVLVLTAKNVCARENLLGLLRGDGIAPDLDAIVGLKRGPRPRVRQYSWRELANVALSHGLVPVRHGFYDSVPSVPSPAEGDWLLAHPHQLRSHFYLVLRRTPELSALRFSGYMLRHATRAAVRFGRDRISARIRALAPA